MRYCTVCRGAERSGNGYTAVDEDTGRLLALPSAECVRCGSIRPDADRIAAMPDVDIPPSVRVRLTSPPRDSGWVARELAITIPIPRSARLKGYDS
jgi:hypothetical protein